MTLGLTEIDAVVAELAGALEGAVLAGVDALPGPALRIRFQVRGADVRVRLSARPRMARLHLDPVPRDARADADAAMDGTRAFAARLGSQLRGSPLRAVKRLYGDRVVGFEFDVAGDPRPATLVFECSGHHPNAFLLDGHGVIRASLEKSRSLRRDLQPGSRYQRPLAHEREPLEAVRFMGARVSEAIAAWYGAEEDREDRARAAVDVRAALKSRLLHEERRTVAIAADLARARAAAAEVAEGQAEDPRSLRLAAEVQRLEAREREVQVAADHVRRAVTAIHGNDPEALEEARRFLRQTAPLPPPGREGPRGGSRDERGRFERPDGRFAPRSDRPDRPDGRFAPRSDRPDRPDARFAPRPDRPDARFAPRSDRPSRPDRPDGRFAPRADRPDRPPRPDRPQGPGGRAPGRPDRPDGRFAPRPDRPSRPDRPDRPPRPDRPDRPPRGPSGPGGAPSRASAPAKAPRRRIVGGSGTPGK